MTACNAIFQSVSNPLTLPQKEPSIILRFIYPP